MERLEQFCRKRGLRLTEHRRIVLEVLRTATDHPFEIHRRAAAEHRIGMASVYRALNSLSMTRHAFRDGKARCERAGIVPHPHPIDMRTGRILELRRLGCVGGPGNLTFRQVTLM